MSTKMWSGEHCLKQRCCLTQSQRRRVSFLRELPKVWRTKGGLQCMLSPFWLKPVCLKPFLFKALLLTRVDLFVLALLCLLLVSVETTPNASQGMGGCSRRMCSDHPRTPSTVSEVARCVSGEFHPRRSREMLKVSPGLRREGDGVNHQHKSFPRSRSTPLNDVLLNSKVLSRRLETPEGPRAAQVPPFTVQLAQCEQFVARAEKRVTTHDEERIMLVKQLQDGKQRLQKLRDPIARTSTSSATRLGSTGCESATDAQHSAVRAGRSCGADSGRQGRRVAARNKESAQDSTSPPCPRWSQESFPSGWKTDRRM